jgi:hypothetical protein
LLFVSHSSFLTTNFSLFSRASAEKYTIAWLSDTQTYYNETLPVFFSMTEYIAEMKDELNIKYVVHTGDVVGMPKRDRFRDAYDALSVMGIPYGVLPGNHDQLDDGTARQFLYVFPPLESNAELGIERGSFEEGMCRYDALRIGSVDFLFVYIAYPGLTAARVNWANEVIASHPFHVVFLCTHEYLTPSSTYMTTGEKLQEKVAAVNENVFMTLCGHINNVDTIASTFDDGWQTRTVYNSVANFQYMFDKDWKLGGGFIRFIEIDEEAGTLRLYSYSPWHDEYMQILAKAKTQTDTLDIPWIEFSLK